MEKQSRWHQFANGFAITELTDVEALLVNECNIAMLAIACFMLKTILKYREKMAVFRRKHPKIQKYVSFPKEILLDDRLSSNAKVILALIISEAREDDEYYHYQPSHLGMTIEEYNEAMDELVVNHFVRAKGEYHYIPCNESEPFSHFSPEDSKVEDAFKHFQP